MIQDPADDLLGIVRRSGKTPGSTDRREMDLIRRRFGLSLPPPFVEVPADGESMAVRRAVAVDGPAIAAVKWRSWRLAYRGLLPEAFLDDLDVVPPSGYWIARALMPPSPRHHLFVAGRPGTVLGLADVGPWRHAGLDPATTGELNVLYVDPVVQRRGIGRALLDAAVRQARVSGPAELALWVAEGNAGARHFYETAGWVCDGAKQRVELGPGVALDEARYRFGDRTV